MNCYRRYGCVCYNVAGVEFHASYRVFPYADYWCCFAYSNLPVPVVMPEYAWRYNEPTLALQYKASFKQLTGLVYAAIRHQHGHRPPALLTYVAIYAPVHP